MAATDTNRFTRTCPTCQSIFKFGPGRGQARLYCNPKCAPPKAPITKRCSCVGCTRVARSSLAEHCEAHYYQLRRTGCTRPIAVPRQCGGPCDYCGRPVDDGSRFCGRRCSTRYARGNPLVKACTVCGNEFDPLVGTGKDRVTCGLECRAHQARLINVASYRRKVSTESGKERVRSAEYKRKARKRKATIEEVSRNAVMRQSGWTCHICMEPIPRHAKWPDSKFGTVDHVVPLALGGAHAYYNCKAAHLGCNCRKGARIIGQLGLSLALSA